jgi:hypothetical protein
MIYMKYEFFEPVRAVYVIQMKYFVKANSTK